MSEVEPQAKESPASEEPGEPETVKTETAPPGEDGKPAEAGGVRQVGGGTPPRSRRQWLRRYWPFVVLGGCTLGLVVAVVIAIKASEEPDPGKAQAPPSAAPAGPVEAFIDEQAGFSLSYPKGWQKVAIPPEASDLRLVLSAGGAASEGSAGAPAGEDGMWVRAFAPDKIDQKINEFEAELKSITGDKPCGSEGSACLRQEQVTVAGAVGVRYVYTVPDQASGQAAIHVQYFLRRGAGNMYVLVFQAIPTGDLDRLAPAFDQVLASFQIRDQTPAQPQSTTQPR